MIVSIVPADVGKPTIRLEKAKVQDGSCYWKNAVYETVKFVQEPKSGKIHERIYHFIVGTGSSKAGVVGEASIDFSSYALSTKISSVSLPLKNSKSETFLHVSIQRMPESFDQREVEEIENVRLNSEDRSLRAQLSNGEIDGNVKTNSIEDPPPLNKSINPNVEMNGKRRTSSGSDITMSSSDSSLGLDTPQEIQVKTENIHQERNNFFSSSNNGLLLQRPTSEASGVVYKDCQKSWEWLGGMALEASTDDSSGTPRETLVRVVSEEAPDTVVEKLKYELTALARQAEMSELELQTLRKQIVKESKRGQDLSREIIKLKEERNNFKEECEKLKTFQSRFDEAKARNTLQFEGADPQALVEELRQELNYEKDLNNNLRVQLQKTQESNSELILAVHDLDEMLEQKNKEIADLVDKLAPFGCAESMQELKYKCETDDDDADQKALEELVKDHSDAKDAYFLEQKLMDLQSEIEIYRRERDEVEMQMEQLALDYEILKQENHDMSHKLEQSQLQEQLKMQYECSSSYATLNELEAQIESLEKELSMRSQEFSDSLNTISELESQIKNLENELKHRSQEYSESLITTKDLEARVKNFEGELKNRSQEHSGSLITIKQLEDHIKALEEELENQARGFETDLQALTCAKVEQEQRAIQAEETLRKMRWRNVSTAEHLQEEFKKLSTQMASTFESNESLATKALAEANELRLQKTRLEEKLQKASESLQKVREHYESRLHELSGLAVSKSNQAEELQSVVEDKSMQLEHQLKHAEEIQAQLAQEITILKTEIETLVTENKALSKIAEERAALASELVELRKSFVELELQFNQGNNEKAELESRIILVKEKAEQSVVDLHNMTCIKDEKELMAKNLQLEVEALKAHCNELKQTLSGDELEKEKLRKQVLQLKSDLKKKEDAFSSMEKKHKDCNGRVIVPDGAKATLKNNKLQPAYRGNREVANLKDKIKSLEDQIKLKETALEKSENSFLEKEKNLQNKIEELEQILHTLSHNTTSLCKQKSDKATEVSEDLMLNGGLVEVTATAENLCNMDSILGDNDSQSSGIRRIGDDSLEKESTSFLIDDSRKFEELLCEITLLKDRNKLMEDELKEMQERYSEISLKFAEVEGERQQLVMRLRNLKNAKKSHA